MKGGIRINTIWELQKERFRRKDPLAALYLTQTLPRFPDCPLAEKEVHSVADGIKSYLQNSFLQKASAEYGVRHPVFAFVTVKLPRNDPNLLAIVLHTRAEIRHETIYEKHVYLYYADNGSLPVLAKDLITAHTKHPLGVKGLNAYDTVTGKEYTLKAKYQSKNEPA